MNQLTWLFKKFPYSNSRRRTKALIGLSLGGVIILGCQNLLRTPRSEVSEETMPQFVASVKVYLQDAEKRTVLAGEFDRKSCLNGFPSLWSSNFKSSLGQHRFDFDMMALAQAKGNDIVVRTQQQRFQVQVDGLPTGLKEQKLCDLPSGTEGVYFPLDSLAGQDFVRLLQNVAPDCKFVATKDRDFQCELNHPDGKAVLAHLESLKKQMSTRWNHQPYLLIRRLTLSTQLLQAMDSRDSARDIGRVCRIVSFSLPHELPLSFRSKTWQQKVCESKNPDPDLIMIGVDQAAKEIEALAKRIEDSSLIGLFTLSVPRDKSPAKEYWISLQPEDQTELAQNEAPALTPCVWHPLFSDQPEKELVAAELGQISSSGKSFCIPLPALARAKKEAATYIRASMASEMEFQIANGQSKMLRLPTGDYRYSVTQYNGPTAEEVFTADEVTPLSAGKVSWKNNRPHLVIKSW